MRALLDTHILHRWVFDPRRLDAPQRRLIDRAGKHGDLWVSEISFWEIASHVERGRLDLGGMALDEWLERAAAEPLVRRHGITPAVAQELTTLSATRDWDPADRIIVATARVLRATLVTNDARIHESKLVDVT